MFGDGGLFGDEQARARITAAPASGSTACSGAPPSTPSPSCRWSRPIRSAASSSPTGTRRRRRPNERFKVNIYILGRALRADGVRASVFRQTSQWRGTWADAPVALNTSTDLENAILTRARQLRMSGVQQWNRRQALTPGPAPPR